MNGNAIFIGTDTEWLNYGMTGYAETETVGLRKVITFKPHGSNDEFYLSPNQVQFV